MRIICGRYSEEEKRENPMTLYHGSDQIIEIPELRFSIRTLDFGPGFYTITNKEQAVNFAIKVYDRSKRAGNVPKGRFISILCGSITTSGQIAVNTVTRIRRCRHLLL